MSLLAQIKTDYLTARKAKDVIAVPLLSTLIGEAEAIGKNDGNRLTTDQEVIALIKKFIKGVNETLAVVSMANAINTHPAFKERVILQAYLPHQLSESELREMLKVTKASHEQAGISGNKLIGSLQQELKGRFPGQYDGAVAARLIKEMLQ